MHPITEEKHWVPDADLGGVELCTVDRPNRRKGSGRCGRGSNLVEATPTSMKMM